ncbi:MAG: NotI family restriction endonuclease [Polaromonas sp.]
MILVDTSSTNEDELRWVAAEIQAVYFSGREMASEFKAISQNVADGGDGLIWPTEVRRPDYRSSGPKRLMPQLQIKVPTLRRWGKKMAVLVDEAFFQSLGKMEPVGDLSNADIAWFRVSFSITPATRRYQIERGGVLLTTLEESVKGLTAGAPVSRAVFEARIKQKLQAP